jgi:hypothetical protein
MTLYNVFGLISQVYGEVLLIYSVVQNWISNIFFLTEIGQLNLTFPQFCEFFT